MRRRAFLQLVGIALLPLPDVAMGKESRAHIQLYNGDEPVSDPLPVEFRFNSHMKVTLRVDQSIHVNRAVLRAPEVGERSQNFTHLNVTPMDTLDVDWICNLDE